MAPIRRALQAAPGVDMVTPMATVRRACMRLGIAATGSLLLSLGVLMFLVETPPVATWFIASAGLAALSYGTAMVAAYFER